MDANFLLDTFNLNTCRSWYDGPESTGGCDGNYCVKNENCQHLCCWSNYCDGGNDCKNEEQKNESSSSWAIWLSLFMCALCIGGIVFIVVMRRKRMNANGEGSHS